MGGRKDREGNRNQVFRICNKEEWGNEGQITELKKKVNRVVGQVWGIEERRFRDDFRRRMLLFRYLVLGIVMYGAEVWRWRKGKELEGIQKKYIKWFLNLDSCTPEYIIYKETNVESIESIAGRRAVSFEEKALKDGDRKLIIECIKERKKRSMREGGGDEREGFYRQNGFSSEGIKRERYGRV